MGLHEQGKREGIVIGLRIAANMLRTAAAEINGRWGDRSEAICNERRDAVREMYQEIEAHANEVEYPKQRSQDERIDSCKDCRFEHDPKIGHFGGLRWTPCERHEHPLRESKEQ